jgi:uncharacterized protein YdbL (DUF1318 family)
MAHRVRHAFTLVALGLVLSLSLVLSLPAGAQSLDEMRGSGAVGERFDGYLVARDASAAGFVNQVNAQRKKIYQERATAQGVPAEQVGRVYADKIFKDAPAGTWVQKPDGSWIRK